MTFQIVDGVYHVGAQDWDRRLFDELIPLPDGTSYNAYLIRASEKTALIDSVDPTKTGELIKKLDELEVKSIDYIIANHAEQDHSGSIPELLEKFPEAVVITNQKCKEFLIDLLLIPEEKFQIITDGDVISLGDKTLEFILTPWVHWPETMSAYLQEDKILFSCDFFGSHFATSDLFVKDEAKTIDDAKRYYAEIMMPFRQIIKKNIEKIQEKEIKYIAASHGPVYDKPEIIINAYTDWISDEVKNTVIIPYVSMHESTEKMVDYLVNSLTKKNISVKPFNLSETDLGDLAKDLTDSATVVIGSSTVLAGAHPKAIYVSHLVNALRPKTRFASIIGSYGWGGRTVEQITEILKHLNLDFIEPVMIKGHPKEDDYKKLDELAEKIHDKHKNINLV